MIKAAAGRDFTVLVTETRLEQAETEIFSTGVNKFGQLGIGEVSDCQDFTKISPLSNLMYQQTEGAKATSMRVQDLSCGMDHCVLATDMGVIFEWGANSRGQLGNKKKNFSEHPLIVKTLNDRKLIDLACRDDSTAVVVEANIKNTPTDK